MSRNELHLETVNILGVPIAATDPDRAATLIEQWIEQDIRTYITLTSVHGVIESQDSEEIKRIHNAAGACLPDGMPTVWVGRLYGHRNMRRVYGPDLMLEVIKRSEKKGYTHFFYGGKGGVPELLKERLVARFPDLKIVGTFSPPFRLMDEQEERELKSMIDSAAPDIVWVGLSTPKQEKWMAAHLGKLDAKLLIGVGAAFDFHAGLLRQAPRWMSRIGLEWFFRLCMEPRRLWRRYFFNNPRFIWLVFKQFLTRSRP